MRLNTLSPEAGSRQNRKRAGRGIGCGLGKTCGRGHKGQKSRSGGFHKVGFEGGQMPLQRRLPKVGFRSRLAKITSEITLYEIASANADVVDMNVLHAADILPHSIKRGKVILSGEINKPVTLKGLRVTKGARAAIEAAGGKVED